MFICIGGICAIVFFPQLEALYRDWSKVAIDCPRVSPANLEVIRANLKNTSLLNPLDISIGKNYQIESEAKELNYIKVEEGEIVLKNLEFRDITP